MARHKLGKTAKAMLKELGEDNPRKIKRTGKPLSEEQREAAIKNLEKARAKRGVSGNSTIHETIRDMDEDDNLHWKKVKSWIKDLEEELKGNKAMKDSSKWQDRLDYQSKENYVSNLKKYLSTGIYFDFRFGAHGEGRMLHVCKAMAYWKDGTPKRSLNTWYADIGEVWTKELAEKLGLQINGKSYDS